MVIASWRKIQMEDREGCYFEACLSDKLPVDEAAQAAGQRVPRVFAFAPQPTYQWH